MGACGGGARGRRRNGADGDGCGRMGPENGVEKGGRWVQLRQHGRDSWEDS